MRSELGTEEVVCCLSCVLMVAGVLIGSGDKERNSLALAGYMQRELTSDQETSCVWKSTYLASHCFPQKLPMLPLSLKPRKLPWFLNRNHFGALLR